MKSPVYHDLYCLFLGKTYLILGIFHMHLITIDTSVIIHISYYTKADDISFVHVVSDWRSGA